MLETGGGSLKDVIVADLEGQLIAEGSQLVSVTNQLKLIAADSKRYKTDVADTEQILRLIGRRCVGC